MPPMMVTRIVINIIPIALRLLLHKDSNNHQKRNYQKLQND